MKTISSISFWERISNYSLILLSSILCLSNSICFYAWYQASKQIGWVPEGASIYDPHSMNWSSSFWDIIDMAILLAFFSVLLILLILGILFFNSRVRMKKTIGGFAWISISLFGILVVGGFMSWWLD